MPRPVVAVEIALDDAPREIGGVRDSQIHPPAADRRVAAAVAERLPRLSLTGRAGTTDEQLENLFDDWLASLDS